MRVVPGRPDVNAQRMLHWLGHAREAKAEIVVFSEMCVSGYLIGDHWEVDALVRDYADWSEVIREASDGLTVVFGNVALDENHIGEDGRLRKFNAVYVCHDRQFVYRRGLPLQLPHGVHAKTLQPNYRYFDDDRHFYSLRKLAAARGDDIYDWCQPYQVPCRGGRRLKFGVQLCEDLWCQDYAHHDGVLNTVSAYRERGAEVVFNLSASPWTWRKNDKRNRVIAEVLSSAKVPLCYVNQVGAQNNGKNIVVFDGDTSAYAADGSVHAKAPPWREAMVVLPSLDPLPPEQEENAARLEGITTGLRHLDDTRGAENRFLLGMSGGIDSSLVACLLHRALGSGRVFGLNMPTHFNADITIGNAANLSAKLGIHYQSFPIQDLYETLAARIKTARFKAESGRYSRLVDENLQARIRGADVLSGVAAKCGLVYTNNGNKTETALGYATLYGDVNGAVAPIADLYKTDVFALARYLNESVYGEEVIPANLYNGTTVPSAELSDAQDVTKGLGDPIKYGYHDAVLRQIIEFRAHPMDLMRWHLEGSLFEQLDWREEAAFSAYFPTAKSWIEDLEWVANQLRSNYFKRIQAPPILILSKRAFGFDLRESQLPAYLPREYPALRAKILALG